MNQEMPSDLTGHLISVDGRPARKVLRWEAQWSMAPSKVPHVLWIKFDGDGKKFSRFESVGSDFPQLAIAE